MGRRRKMVVEVAVDAPAKRGGEGAEVEVEMK